MKQYFIYSFILCIGIIIGYAIGKINVNPVKEIFPISCTHKGITYKDGEEFQDDCNSCSCQTGEVNCTLMACNVEIPSTN